MRDLLKVFPEGAAAETAAAATSPAVAPARDLAMVRERLARLAGETGDGRHVWRSLEQVADSDEFRELLYREFPRQASEWVGGEVSRRRFLQLGSASLALGGLAGCVRQPSEKIVPYVRQPEEVVPGNPLYFASTAAPAGHPIGVLVESHLGRPTKIEGNPDHPASLGATDLFTQASILDLYDPDRLQAPSHLGRPRPWSAFAASLDGAMQAQRALGGAGLRIVTGAVTSPTLEEQLTGLLADYPEARWHVWEPAAANAPATDGGGAVRYDLGRADVVVTLDSDLLTQGPGAVRYARDWTARRRAGSPAWQGEGPDDGGGATAMPRLYAVESSPTATGSMADHRLALPPSELARFAAALAAALGAGGAAAAEPFSRPQAALWVHEVARDLERPDCRGL
jgi:molybdopterin-containing oxidoreductase family iron-sulfur binding subunit